MNSHHSHSNLFYYIITVVFVLIFIISSVLTPALLDCLCRQGVGKSAVCFSCQTNHISAERVEFRRKGRAATSGDAVMLLVNVVITIKQLAFIITAVICDTIQQVALGHPTLKLMRKNPGPLTKVKSQPTWITETQKHRVCVVVRISWCLTMMKSAL